MNNILKINNLSKKYGRIQALDNLELTIGQGQIWGILGPNGSGKTTTLGIILGILHQDGGDFEWFEGKYGHNAIDNLKIVAQIKKAESDDIHHLLEIVDLSHRKKSPFKTYSLGMKQRLAIAATLIGNPEVLIFDEPTNGLDPQGIAEVRSILKRIADTGKTVIMASHMLDEVEKICDHVAIIKKGKLLASGKIGQIIHDDKIVEIGAEDNDKLKHWIEINGWKYSKAANIGFEIQIPKDYEHALINKKAFEDGILLNHLIVKKRRLEEEFLHITKN
jgi:ABC-2 type transport system ATP-binding protein